MQDQNCGTYAMTFALLCIGAIHHTNDPCQFLPQIKKITFRILNAKGIKILQTSVNDIDFCLISFRTN
jgi:hypothetical protein